MNTINAPLPDQALAGKEAPLDEVMLAMDVVDTLRHDQKMLEMDLSHAKRRADLIDRLRDIYQAQGIEVPDSILEEGVKALEDERFTYHPPKPGLSRSLGKLYINRKKWGRPLIFVTGLVALALTINYAAIDGPRKAREAAQIRLLTDEIPARIDTARQDAISIAANEHIKNTILSLADEAAQAAKTGNSKDAKALTEQLEQYSADLAQSYEVRIISRPGESSGIFRLNDDNDDVKNYYLIVEAISASGRKIPVNIISEENQISQRVTSWGVRVPATVYNAVAADKRDDQIIQNALIGTKVRGQVNPEYSVETLGGMITSW